MSSPSTLPLGNLGSQTLGEPILYSSKQKRPYRWIGVLLSLSAVTVGTIALGIWIGRKGGGTPIQSLVASIFATFLFGALVGLAEILSRYRDEPTLAAGTMAGISYLVFNGTISVVAFAILRAYPDKILPAVSSDLFLCAVAAGFGAMVIFRSKLFTFKSADGNEYPIGPAIVLDTILKMIDSKIDRRRATDRQTRVFNAMFAIKDFPNVADYIGASLLSFQNLSAEDKKQIGSLINEYKTSSWPDSLKNIGLGFAFLTLAGEANFDIVVSNIKTYIKGQADAALSGKPMQPFPQGLSQPHQL